MKVEIPRGLTNSLIHLSHRRVAHWQRNFESGLATAYQTPLRGTCDVPMQELQLLQHGPAINCYVNSYVQIYQ